MTRGDRCGGRCPAGIGLTDKGIVQLVHLVSDFCFLVSPGVENRYDYRDLWRRRWVLAGCRDEGEAAGDNTRGIKT